MSNVVLASDLRASRFSVHLFIKFLIYYVNYINVTKEGKFTTRRIMLTVMVDIVCTVLQ